MIIPYLTGWGTYAQTFEAVKSKTLTAYEGKSYSYKTEVRLQPGFKIQAATDGSFYILYGSGNQPPSGDQNFIRTETVLVPGVYTEPQVGLLNVTQKTTSYQYIDGLGRNSQNVVVQNTPSFYDVLTPIEYDQFGRQPKEYLPFSFDNDAPGKFNRTAITNQAQFYSYDARPFSESFFEPSPLNRVTNKFGSGADWNSANRDVKSIMKLNQASDNIIRWDYYISGLPTQNGTYPANHLTIQETIDEEGQITREYKDSRGLLVMRRVGDGTSWFDTQYIYSPSGLLMIVIQPEGVTRLATEFDPVGANKQSFLNRWCFQYQFDDEQRLIAKRIPGWEPNYWAYTIYDVWNRPVLTQTPAQSARNEWSFTKYDRFNRPIMTGVITTSTPVATLRTNAAASTQRFETEAPSTSEGYTLITTYPPVTAADLRTITYYDSYSFLTYTNWETDITLSNFNYQNISGYPQYNSSNATVSDILLQVKGHATGSKTKVLSSTPTRWLSSVTWYDKKYRPIQVISENYVGGVDRSTSLVDFTGKTLKTLLAHSSSGTSMTVLNEFEYDHAGRLKKTYQTTDGGTRVLLASSYYNELGQLVEKNIHSTDETNFLQSVDMRYNIRGWLTSINNSSLTNDGLMNNDANDLFGLEMLYNPTTAPTINGYTAPKLYNGNISAIKWKANTQQGTPEERIFGFDYDVLNRFEKAWYATNNNQGTWTGNAGLFDEAVQSYDKNGNIQGIERYGNVQGNRTQIDSTYYGYNYAGSSISNFGGVSNRLLKLKDAGNSLGFKDGSAQLNEEFMYDRSGNLIFDQNKQISNITYNYLNLPEVIEFTRPGGQLDQIEYMYDAAGIKLKTTVKINGQTVWVTDYVGGAQYDNDQLSFVATPEGRVIKNSSGWDYEYFYKDHQGNVRLTYGQLKETVSYKATMENPNPTYSNKEENDFRNIASPNGTTTRYLDPTFNYTKASDQVLVPNKSSQTNAFLNTPVGPAKRLTMATGDKVKVDVYGRYTVQPGNTATIVMNTLVSAIAATTFGFNPGETGYTSFNTNVPTISSGRSGSATLPKAYLAYLFFDASNNFVPGNSGATSLSTSAYTAFERLSLSFTAPQAGSLYVYVVNETNVSSTAGNVYWDDMLIIHQKTNAGVQVTQASDYYPFGLPFNTYQSLRINDNNSNVQNNRYGFQGQEWQSDLDLGWSQFKWRMHDPAIGRFSAVDPLSDKYLYNGTYVFSENHLTAHVELEGLESEWFYNAMNFFSPVAINFNYTSGTHRSGMGLDISVGLPKSLPFSYRKSFGFSFNSYDAIQQKPVFETRSGTETSYGGFLSVETTKYVSGETSQTTGTVTLGGPLVNISHENDWFPDNIASKLNPFGIHPSNLGDGGDRFRTAALKVNLGPISAGFNLATGDPGLKPKDRIENNGTYVPNPSLGNDPDRYRLGIGYFGVGNYKLGINSESLRNGIQNGLHKRIGSPLFKVLPRNTEFFFEYSTGAKW